MNHLVVKNCHINEGRVNICVPLVATNLQELREELSMAELHDADIVEWRMDHYKDILDEDSLRAAATLIREQLHEQVLLFTFRRFVEGGASHIDDEDYLKINQSVIAHQFTDMLDVEYSCGKEMRETLIQQAHDNGIVVIVSSHDFQKTPSHDQLVEHFQAMEACGGDLIKIACMPQCLEDVFTLMSASRHAYEQYCHVPVVSMSMGTLGMVSRVFAQLSKSAISFASLKQASAPGQLPASDMKQFLHVLDAHFNDPSNKM